MSDSGLLAHEYGRAASASRSLGETLLTEEKRHAGVETAEMDRGRRQQVARQALANLLDPASAGVSTRQAWEVPGELLERVARSGVRPEDLHRVAEHLASADDRVDERDVATLAHVARAATAEASTVFGRLTDG